ncbi:hypothetical protein CCR75_004616 [Bremia lactucae]|uniref:Uncharacterized protein n=1 Tax=Bremia lactucae TaxID=4779 RepID=A0A976ILU2_BRELC|nr:hypothetical protein CCR75_004616 [Bremia lactucae]
MDPLSTEVIVSHSGGNQQWTPAMKVKQIQPDVSRNAEKKESETPQPRETDQLFDPHASSSSGAEGGDTPGNSLTMKRSKHSNAVMTVMNQSTLGHKEHRDTIDDLKLSIESLRVLIQAQGLETTALSLWRTQDDGMLIDPEQNKYCCLRDALRAYTYQVGGMISREDMYYLAILRRIVAEAKLPLVDGPITLLALGNIIPDEQYHTSKELFSIGFETLVKVYISKPVIIAFQLRCKILPGHEIKVPIFSVELFKSAVSRCVHSNLLHLYNGGPAEIVFRSYAASKAWKKALTYFETLPPDELIAIVSESRFKAESDDCGKPIGVLTSASEENGFGLLRRGIACVLEGLPRVLLCTNYQFWEEQHSIAPDVHAKIRSRMRRQVKDVLKTQKVVSYDALKRQLSQEAMLLEHCRDADDMQRTDLQKEKERRKAGKRSVREAAQRLLKIEMNGEETAKEALRQAKEERKNTILEAKMEAARQKDIRKEAMRLAREEEKRIREDEKGVKRALREEEKCKKMEKKERIMKRRVEEARQRRQKREEEKAIFETGVATSLPSRRSIRTKTTFDTQTCKQQLLALLKFVEDERERRRQIRVWKKRSEIENIVWTRVKSLYTEKLNYDLATFEKHYKRDSTACADSKFPSNLISTVKELAAIPAESHADLLFVWDFVSTFSDCLKLTVLPSLGLFIDIMTLKDGSSPVGDSDLDDDSIGIYFASLHAELLKLIISEYFPLLQMGNTLEEFHRTRPMNVFSWPELARQVCQMAMEFKHPSADDHLLKSIKGLKSYRDDAVTHLLRKKLHRRGINLLEGVAYDEENEDANANDSHRLSSYSLASEDRILPSDYYGAVLVGGVLRNFTVGEKHHHLVVSEIVAPHDKSLAVTEDLSQCVTSEAKGENADRIKVGDYLIFMNGKDVRKVSLDDFKVLASEIPTPHGLLMSSVIPVAKSTMKNVATTKGSTKVKCCEFVLKLLRAKEIATPFNQPVDADLYPDYYTSGDIAEPMDLGTISEKIGDEDYEYNDVESFVDDVHLVWNNCYAYNSLTAEISIFAQKLSIIFERLMKEWVYTTENRLLMATEEDNCRKCQTIHAKHRLLLCDRCDAPYHTFCLDVPLSEVPTCEWVCPLCLADPSFSPERFRKRARNSAAGLQGNFNKTKLKADVLTDFGKRLMTAINLLSQESYAELAVSNRLKVLRVLCELVEETSAVQSVYRILEEKSKDARKKIGEPLADLEREWDRFSPPRSPQGLERTNTFIIDGVEHKLTDTLLTYLEDKAKAELDSKPLPVHPQNAEAESYVAAGNAKTGFAALPRETRQEDLSDNSEDDEGLILEELGDQFLLTSSGYCEVNSVKKENELVLHRPLCFFCDLEDGILNGQLNCCKQSPLTGHTSLLNHFEIPELLSKDRPDVLAVRLLQTNDGTNVILKDTSEGVQYSNCFAPIHQIDQGDISALADNVKEIVYAINDRIVFGMSVAAIQDQLRIAAHPTLLYLTSLPVEAVRASVSIVKSHNLSMGLILASYQSFIFVQSYCTPEIGFAELSGQVFPGDVLYMVNDVLTHGKDIAEIDAMLDNSSESVYAVFVRHPSVKMKKASEEWQRIVYDTASQRAKETSFRAAHINKPFLFEVVFTDGPLGLALSLETRGVVVNSLNAFADGSPGQASLSGRVLRGDLVEGVNGTTFGPVSDLSQFTSWLLSLPRPLTISFSRQLRQGTRQCENLEQTNKIVADFLANSSLLCKQLKLPRSSKIKTIHVESARLPFEAENLLESLGVISINDGVCGQTSVATIAIGDSIVGLNGKSVAGLSWISFKTLCSELLPTCPVYLHLLPIRRFKLLQAHENCVESANMAWSECESIFSRLEKARGLDNYLKWIIIPRTLALGECRNGYSFYRFFSDRDRLFVMSPEKKWSICATRKHLMQLVGYLEQSSNDFIIATRIRRCLHWMFCDNDVKFQQGLAYCDHTGKCLSYKKMFGVEEEMLLVMDEEIEKYTSHVSYNGRRFFLGSFHTQQEAENALYRAVTSISRTELHVVVAADVSMLHRAHFPSCMNAIHPKAKSVINRILSCKYECGSFMNGQFGEKLKPLSYKVYEVIQNGLQARKSEEMLKREHVHLKDQLARQTVDQMKRRRYADTKTETRPLQHKALGTGHNSVSLKRSLQVLVDHGRAMLAAWNQFAALISVETTSRLAYACLASFEEVKKVVSLVITNPSAISQDPKTFVCLHHAYIMGLVCAMATQALTTSQKTPSDSALVKQVADAFATAILCCVDPSSILRARALSGFAAAAKKCEPTQRAGGLSVELHNVANFVLVFLRTSRYLSNASFGDLSSCRPIFEASTLGVSSLPASFVQQVYLLENIRQAYYRQINTSSMNINSVSCQQKSPVPSMPGTTLMSTAREIQTKYTIPTDLCNNSALVDVKFGFGPLGIVINYSHRGTIVVTEFSNDSYRLSGQAQLSGRVEVGDEVYAVNGQMLEVIGMEGFKGMVASSKRPLIVTFRKLLPDAAGVIKASENIAGRSAEYPVNASLQIAVASASNQLLTTVIQQERLSNGYNQQQLHLNNNTIRGSQQPSSGLITASIPYAVIDGNCFNSAPVQSPLMNDDVNLYSNLSPLNQSPREMMADLTGQTIPPAAMVTQNYNSIPKVNNGVNAAIMSDQLSEKWQAAPLNSVMQHIPLEQAQNAITLKGGGSVLQSSMPTESATMSYSSLALPALGVSDSSQSDASIEELATFVARNDPLFPIEALSDTVCRVIGDVDTKEIASTPLYPRLSKSADDKVIANVDTKPKSLTMSQAIIPTTLYTDGDQSGTLKQQNRAVPLARLTLESSMNQESIRVAMSLPNTAKDQATSANYILPAHQSNLGLPEDKLLFQSMKSSDCARTSENKVCLTEETASRRSSRVSRKSSNIAVLYDPDYIKAHTRGGVGGENSVGLDDPTDGQIGELSTELLEDYSATIRPLKKNLPRSLRLLGAQLLMMECAIPREAFRFGKWGRSVRAAWAEMVYTCGTSAVLMEAVVFLEANIDPDRLDPCWKASPLPSAKVAISTATIASAAMRMYSLDDAILYGRITRGGKRKHRNQNFNQPRLPQKIPTNSQKEDASGKGSHQLPFVGRMSNKLIAMADEMIDKILEAERERSWTTYAYQKAKCEVAAIASLTDDEIEQWLQVNRVQQAPTQKGSERHKTLKRKCPGSLPLSSNGQPSSIRNRKVQGSRAKAPNSKLNLQERTQYVELRCYKMKSLQHRLPFGSAQDTTLSSRLQHIMNILLQNELALAFSAPVNVDEVPGYAEVVKHPKDLGTIKFQLSRGFYNQRFELLVQDIDLVWENCFKFNRIDADISKCANRLRSIFDRLFEQWISEVKPDTPLSHLASEESCRQCGQMSAQDSMLLCDSCDAAYHAFCLQPPLSTIPPGNWYCVRCPLKKIIM